MTKRTKRLFLCQGCHNNQGVCAQGVNCSLVGKPVDAIEYKRGMRYEECHRRAQEPGGVSQQELVVLARAARGQAGRGESLTIFDPWYSDTHAPVGV